ncbi:hypothetical protein Tdes44962_MAKER02245 [Teratosphaeria destructans]|uniref:ABM domain-containing protein n=1 Tax=Teratosphaeria destructans TaxID=418781 RepID=A0A9W7SU23_9PEZI|nr:hypothetical protein Tdes44962_MAKER02245 [Teratosphaeria destructans]
MTTTEIAWFPLKAGSNIGDPDSEAASVLKSTFDTLRQQDGLQQVQFGTWVENPSNFQLFVNWDSKKHHEAFIASSTYRPFFKRFGALVDDSSPGSGIFHVDFDAPAALAKVFSAPVTEVATFYFEGAPPADYVQQAKKLATVLEENKVDGYLGATLGTSYEEIEREGVKGKVGVLVVGWQSVEAHLAFRETHMFKDNIHLVRSDAKKIEMHHVQFMQAQADA